jgi:hypothetical protein
MTLDDLYLQHAIASFDKQIYLSAMHGKAHWELRLDTHTLSFIGAHQLRNDYTVDYLGTESDTEKTWLWAWGNGVMFKDETSLRSALALKQLGAENHIEAFTSPTLLPPQMICGARLASIASGQCRAGAYFRCAYPDGSLYVLIRDPKFKRPVHRPLTRIARILPMFNSDERNLPQGDFQTAFEHYTQFYRLRYRVEKTHDHIIYTLVPSNQPQTIYGEGVAAPDLTSLAVYFDHKRGFVRCL